MKECFVGILVALEKRAYLVIQSSQKMQNSKTFESIVELVDRWSEQKSLTTRSKTSQNIDTFEIYPPQEEIDKMLCAGVSPHQNSSTAAADAVAHIDLALVASAGAQQGGSA
ncbi:hypothetical protein D9M68_771340 [compost metagenome]